MKPAKIEPQAAALDEMQSDSSRGDENLPSTGERFIPGLGGMIELEHVHRYMFARQACIGKKVLDIACGEGYGSSMLGQVAQEVIGVDIAHEAVAHARKRYSAGHVSFRLGDCAAIPVEDGSIDVVVSFETIEHHDQHEKMMREIRRVLKPDGLLVLSSPDRYEYSELPATRNEFHVRELYRDELMQLVGDHFRNVGVYDQKVLFGSAILSETQATRSWSVHADTLQDPVRGLVRPLFLIALASDGPVPVLDTGVFEQDLAKTSEWQWWIKTLAHRDARIHQLDAQTRQQADRLASLADIEARLVTVTSMVHAVGADRDEARQQHQASLAEIVTLQRQLIAEVAERDTRIQQFEAQIKQQEERLSGLAETEARLATVTSMVHAVGADRDEARQQHQASLAEIVTLQRQLIAEVAERDTRIQQFEAQIKQQEERLSGLAETEARLATVTSMVHAVGADRDEARQQHQASLAEIVTLQRQLIAEVAERDLRTGKFEAQIQAQRERIAGLAEIEARLAAEVEAYENRLASERARAHGAQQAHWLALAAVTAEREAARHEADALRARATAAEAWAKTLVASVDSANAYVRKLEWLLSTTRHALETTTARADTLEFWAASLQAQLRALYDSASWRSTRPLRAIRPLLRALVTAPRAATSRVIRASYHALPLEGRHKSALKAEFFGKFGFALKDTAMYRDWIAFNAAPGRVDTDHQVHGDAGDRDPFGIPVPAIEPAAADEAPTPAPIPQLAEEVTVMTELPTTEPTYSAGSKPLWVADGQREWEDLEVLRGRIESARVAHAQAIAPEPFDLISIAQTDIESTACSLSFPHHERPRVSILLPVYNKVAMTLECLVSISRARGDTTFEVVVADDASTDETAAILASIDGLVIHTNAQNLHFLRNCNAALPRTSGDYVVFLNNDVQVQDGWIDEMVSAFERYDLVGAVGPKIVYPSGHLQEAGVAFNTDMTVDMIGLHDDPQLPRYNYVRRVDYSSGACLMVPRPLLVELGGFSEDFAPAYCEDGDLCLRIRERGLFIYYVPQATVVHRLSATTAADSLDVKRRLVADNLVTFAGKWQQRVEEQADVRAIAFYLPQFYPFPENDLWWGTGFTEWTNVTKAQPNFVGHYQPHLPADLGFYDLRVAKTMDDQADLARRYGLGGFCFYYYWFAGKRLLDLPVERLLETGRPDFPFCLCWANENWTRRWDGQESHVLMAQSHSEADDEAVIRDLMRFFKSPNYIRIDGRPLLVVYRVTLFPDFARTAARWRALCCAEGIGEIYLSMVESFELVGSSFHPSRFGCDATLEFPPQGLAEVVPPSGATLNPDFVGHCVDYRTLALRYCTRPAPAYTRFRGAMPGWDNTARRQDTSYCVEHASPGGFQAWLEHIVDDARRQHFGDERIVFINAWNEWAEGAHLEPDRRFGHTYLEALRNAKDQRGLMRFQRYVL